MNHITLDSEMSSQQSPYFRLEQATTQIMPLSSHLNGQELALEKNLRPQARKYVKWVATAFTSLKSASCDPSFSGSPIPKRNTGPIRSSRIWREVLCHQATEEPIKEPTTFCPSSETVENPGYTPLEAQVLAWKRKYPKLLLFIECGYRYRFFGEDARIAARVLEIAYRHDRPLATSSVPKCNGAEGYVAKFVCQGYKVGIIAQTETAAGRKMAEKSTPFRRELTAVFSKTTFLRAEELDPDGGSMEGRELLLSMSERGDVTSLVGVQPWSGHVVYDQFVDGPSRCLLAQRLLALEPGEIILPQDNLGSQSRNMLAMYLQKRNEYPSSPEEVDPDWFDPARCLELLAASSKFLQKLPELPLGVQGCVSALTLHLKEFNLETAVTQSSSIQPLSEPGLQSMFLPAMTISNLEVVQHRSQRWPTGSESGYSLYSILNRTRSRFGGRLFKRWLVAPLGNVDGIIARQESVVFLHGTPNEAISKMKGMLHKSMDLEVHLMGTLCRRIKPNHFYKLCQTLNEFGEQAIRLLNSVTLPTLLRQMLSNIRDAFASLSIVLDAMNHEAAHKCDWVHIFSDWRFVRTLQTPMRAVEDRESELEHYKAHIKRVLRVPSFEYVVRTGSEYVIEVKRDDHCDIPGDWIVVSSTKYFVRYRTRFIQDTLTSLQFAREALEAACKMSWKRFLDDFTRRFPQYQDGVQSLATIDCLLSLAEVAQADGFCRPTFNHVGPPEFQVEDSRNIVLDSALSSGQTNVPNDIHLTSSGPRAMLLTGPNMGGKSSYVRQVATLAIMAQIGGFVPAKRAHLPVFDAIFLRLGGRDDLLAGKSTLLVEMEEASEIMHSASKHSLVLVDELGRGASSLDGAAIAHSVLDFILRKNQCFCIFVTHYRSLLSVVKRHSSLIKNYHMAFTSPNSADIREIILLLKVVEGPCHQSYGLNVARLAGLDPKILARAQALSHEYRGVQPHGTV